MTGRAKAISLITGLILLTAAVDQGIKALIAATLPLNAVHVVWPGVLYLTHRGNTGVAFSLGDRLPPAVMVGINLAVLALVLVILLRTLRPLLAWRVTRVALALVVGGALGNLIDRIRLGYVIDYLDFRVWPVFNLADACVVVGMLVMAALIIRTEAGKPA